MVTIPTERQGAAPAVEPSRLTWRHWFYFTLIFCLFVTDGMDVTIVSHIFPSLIKEWGVSVGGGIALVVSGGFIAMGIGAFVGGRLADRWGRKSILVAAGVLFSVATALGGTAADFTVFTLWRFIACLGIGAILPAGMTLLADLVPAKRRAALIAASYAGLGLGTTAGASLAAVVLPAEGWRILLVLAGVIPLVVTAVIGFAIPESPAFLASRSATGRDPHPRGRMEPPVTGGSDEPVTYDGAQLSSGAIRRSLAAPFRWTTVLLWVFGFLSLGTQLLIIQYLPTLLQLPVPGLTTVESSTIVAFYGFASVLSLLLLGGILAKWNRFPVIGISLAIAAVVVVVVSLAHNTGFGTLLVVLTVAGFVIPAALGPTRNVLAVEAYPAEMRATGVGMTELSARLGSAGCGAIGGMLIGAGLGLGGMFLVTLIPVGILGATLLGLKVTNR
jgi:AAHS family 4-hydroxybenzoate transporter-like MFS transporter